ncbi:MAG: hypothetical protein K2Q22_04605, partial [Cytophagales bacterium]|nr:hypothetical protein [Cytophagales bacterium]
MIALLAATSYSCNQKSEVSPEGSNTQAEGMVKLVRKLENPYSVSNMQRAYANISKSDARIALSEIVVATTHKYIKFKPKNVEELAVLKQDSSLVLYTYPLDYEISQGSAYHDPSVPA